MTGRQFRILVALTVVSAFLGGAACNLALRGEPAGAQAGGTIQEVVRAKRFEVVDDAGKARIVLDVFPTAVNPAGWPGLMLYDATGKDRGGLTVDPDGDAALRLYDVNGLPRALLRVRSDGSPELSLEGLEDGRLRPIWHAPPSEATW